MYQPLVSVIMTSYNRERYIGEAIESVLCSTLKDFELIICDDGSIDNTVDIARKYATRDSRVKVFINEKNLGDYPNRNKAASHAIGKYLKYVDADDLIYPWGLEILTKTMEDNPEAGFGLCSLPQDNARPFPFQLNPNEAYKYHYLGPGLFHKAPLSSIIKREVFTELGGFDDIRMAGDFNMWHKLALKFPVVLMPHGIVWYREHENQEMGSYRKFLGTYEQLKVKYLKSKDCPLSTSEISLIFKRTKEKYLKDLLKASVTFNTERMKDNLTRLKVLRNV